MIKNKQTRRTIAIFFLLNFLSTMFPYNELYAQTAGPNAPEAGAFEPVDATDMVNLVYGDFTYVLPLLNVPSPEGGYPLALSYHAGIAMDQESSWVGLGWNLNPGAINRNVNGFPDDYHNANSVTNFYSDIDTVTESFVSLGYSWGAGSVGLGVSWGSHKSLGGSVSFGLGNTNITLGTDGNSSVGFGSSYHGLNLGVSLGSNGLNANGGFSLNNGVGFNLSTTGSFGLSFKQNSKGEIIRTSINLSSSGIGISVNSITNDEAGGVNVQSAGVGLSSVSHNTIKMGDYVQKMSSSGTSLIIPSPWGVFDLSFGSQTYQVYLDKHEVTSVNGAINFNKNFAVYLLNEEGKTVKFLGYLYDKDLTEILRGYEGEPYKVVELFNYATNTNNKSTMMDLLEVVAGNEYFKAEATFPNYDKFNVQAQGLSGAMTGRIYENGALYGESFKNKDFSYIVNESVSFIDEFSFKKKVHFYFENEISTYIETPKSILEAPVSEDFLTSFVGKEYSHGILEENKAENIKRRRTANYIEYFTNGEILYSDIAKSKGFLKPIADGFSREKVNEDRGIDAIHTTNNYSGTRSVYLEPSSENPPPVGGIGGFKITSFDGKTYHYSLPVYNFETIERTYNLFEDLNGQIKPEKEGYIEKKQIQPFATHWLLTAVTGSDFIDVNNNGIADKEDYGYWVNFEYGKYSSSFIWSAPYGKDEFISGPPIKRNHPSIMTWIRGRKELYYLNKVKTRTHTAIFVKSKRIDGRSKEFKYGSGYVTNELSNQKSGYNELFTIPEQPPLKLDKILLVKGDDGVDPASGNESHQEVVIKYPMAEGIFKDDLGRYNMMDNVIDDKDNLSSIKNKVIKSIIFNTDYSLVKGAVDSKDGQGRLTLKGVDFRGKEEKSMIPPYSFEYINPQYDFNIFDKDIFGYCRNKNSIWSLSEIMTPSGGKIQVEYEPHRIKPVLNKSLFIPRNYRFENDKLIISTKDNYNPKLGSLVNIVETTLYGPGVSNVSNHENKKVIENRFNQTTQNYEIIVDFNKSELQEIHQDSEILEGILRVYLDYGKGIQQGGARVKRISTIGEKGEFYNMFYSYGVENNGIGYVPLMPKTVRGVSEGAYLSASELPSIKAMYNNIITTTTYGDPQKELDMNKFGGKVQYEFNVFKDKPEFSEDKVKFGNFYEVNKNVKYKSQDDKKEISEITIKENLASIGQLLSVKRFNDKNQLLSTISNAYFLPEKIPNKLGTTQESYHVYKKTKEGSDSKSIGNSITRIRYASVLKSSTELIGNNSITSEFNDFDPITGQARETYSYSSTGIKVKKIGIQAFRKYPQMGSKVDNINNKNMLSQTAGEYTYIYKENDWKPVGVGITTWSNVWDYTFNNNNTDSTNEVWRKHKTFTWKGSKNDDGTLNYIDDFDWTVDASQTSNWQETSNVTRYNQFSQPLEVKDINGNYAATKMGDNYSKVIATANAGYDEMHYSGAEYLASENSSYFDGGISSQGRTADKAHTGKYSVKATSGVQGYLLTMRNSKYRPGKYKVSVWVDKANYGNIRINDGSLKAFNGEKVFAGEWVLMTHYFDLTTGDKNIYVTVSSGTSYIDDFRLHPVSSSMMSYVYNEWDEVSYITGANGLSTHYIYDAAGRLIETQVETVTNVSAGIEGGFEKVSENRYNYKRNNQ